MMASDYTPPVSKLLTLGDVRETSTWLDYRALGLGSEHVPDLIGSDLNGFIVGYLVDLEAVEAAPLMERAFAAGRVDVSIMGDWAEC